MRWLSASYTYSLQYQMCSIEFLIILNYPAITNIFAINPIIRYNGVLAITNIFFGTKALSFSGVPLYHQTAQLSVNKLLLILWHNRLP